MNNSIINYTDKKMEVDIPVIDFIEDEDLILESKYKTKLSKGSKRKTPKTK